MAWLLACFVGAPADALYGQAGHSGMTNPAQQVVKSLFNSNNNEEQICGSDEHHLYLMKTDSAYKARYLEHMKMMEFQLQKGDSDTRSLPPQYTIPVVVHVIHLGEPVGTGSNISDAQIIGAINGLNDRYANVNNQGVNTEINFCLATQDPNGCPTTGIIRVNGSSVPNYASSGIEVDGTCGASEYAVKDLSKWPVLDYYNIWVVKDICNAPPGDVLGYAHFPSGSLYDGTVVDRNYMLSSSSVLAHELGHGLDIRHTHHGDNNGNSCPPNNNCTTDGDFICDTPPHKRADCGSSNPCSSGGIWNNSRYNLMSYCFPASSVERFTNDQKTRMRATMLVYPRVDLLSSVGCQTPPAPQITSSNAPMCSGTTRTLTAIPTGGTFTIQSGPGTINGNILTATGAGTIVVKYTTCAGTALQSITAYLTPAPAITSSGAPICSGTTRTLTANPSGGVFSVVSGPGTINGNILTATGAGTIIIMYSLVQNGCTGTATQTITSNQTPAPVFTSSGDPICSDQTRTLTASPGGGTFSLISGPAILNGNILTSTGAGVIVVQYTVVQNGCSGATTQAITSYLTPMPQITSDDDPICSGGTRILAASPSGGLFIVASGPGTINGNILTATGAGTIVINYSITQNECTGTVTQAITSNQTPAPVFTSSGDPICSDDARTLAATPSGGSFSLISGPAILNGNILTSTGAGIIVIQYTLVQNGCSGGATQQITSYLTPTPQITSDDLPLCSGETRILSATPAGGEFSVSSGPGQVSGNVLTATGPGVITIQYFIEANGCQGVAAQQIVSILTPNPEITSEGSPMCEGGTRLLSGSPAGGVFQVLSGPGQIQGALLTSTGAGVIRIQYAITENNCSGTFTQDITSYAAPEPEIITDAGPMCSGDTRTLEAIPPGGVFTVLSGPGQITGNVLTALGGGLITIDYALSLEGCAGHALQAIVATQTPTPEIVSAESSMCQGGDRVLEGMPTGGSFSLLSGPGEMNGNILTSLGEGLITIKYVVQENGCIGSDMQQIPTYALPQPSITSSNAEMCEGEIRILTGNPDGGVFAVLSGPANLMGNHLVSTGAGPITLAYVVTANGCSGSVTQSIVSNAGPAPILVSDTSPMCASETREMAALPAGGVFEIVSGPGVLQGDQLTSTGEGLIVVRYTVLENGCTGTLMQQIQCFAVPEIEVVEIQSGILQANLTGGMFQWLDCDQGFQPLEGQQANTLVITQTGSYAVMYTQNNCIDTSTCVLVELTSAEYDEVARGFLILPNPTSGDVYIQANKGYGIRTLWVTDPLGNLLQRIDAEGKTIAYLDLSRYPSAIYLLKLESTEGKMYLARIIKM